MEKRHQSLAIPLLLVSYEGEREGKLCITGEGKDWEMPLTRSKKEKWQAVPERLREKTDF